MLHLFCPSSSSPMASPQDSLTGTIPLQPTPAEKESWDYVSVVFWSFKWSWAWSWGYNVRWLRLNHVMCWEALQVAALEQEAGATSFSFQILVTLANDTLLKHRACAWWPVHRKIGLLDLR